LETKELLKKVKQIEIKTKGLSKHIFAGEYHSAFKGRGMTFSEVREYQYGDDVRNIDWNVTARYDKPFIKTFEEERELTVILLIDVSASGLFGTKSRYKNELIAELAAVLSFSAGINNDKVGAIFFSDQIEKFISPNKGKKHILRIIREILDFKPKSTKTDISGAFKYLVNVIKKRSTVFLISDFYNSSFDKALQIASYKHDLIALRIYDEMELRLPDIGLIKVKDSENGEEFWINTSNRNSLREYEKNVQTGNEKLTQTFYKMGVDFANISTDQDIVIPLLKLFKNR
jgi:uncharacterized protein (DUF58 family)